MSQKLLKSRRKLLRSFYCYLSGQDLRETFNCTRVTLKSSCKTMNKSDYVTLAILCITEFNRTRAGCGFPPDGRHPHRLVW